MYFDKPIWQQKIRAANKYYEEWATLFDVEKLERYYEGKQWPGLSTRLEAYKPYTLNLIFSAIQRKLATILLKNPEFELSPTPGNMDWDQQTAINSSNLKQDVINAIIANPNINFAKHLKLAAIDSFFRFGILEINHSADFDNPLKTPIITTEFTKQNVDPLNARIVDEIELPSSEQIFFKHIKASRFRVSTSDSSFLNNCSWCGYFMYVYESTLRNTKGFKFPDQYAFTDAQEELRYAQKSKLNPGALRSAKVCKIWKIWDNETKYQHYFLDNYFDTSLEKEELRFENLPFEDIIWNERVPGNEDSGYYPIPPVYNWISPQDEVNQSREQMRNFRRRYSRKYGYIKGKVEPEEIEKFQSGADGELIEVKDADSIFPIENPTIGATVTQELQVSNDDFNKAASVSQVQQSDRTTATQSKINAGRETILEDAETMDFSDFICRVGRKALILAKEKLVTGLWVKYTQDPGADLFGEVQARGPLYHYVSSEQFDDGYDFTIKLKVIDASPDRMQDEQNKFITFLKLLSTFPMISMSPRLITETAFICGYRNLKVIQDLQKMALVSMMGQVNEGQNNLSQGQPSLNGPAAASETSNSNPNPGAEIDSQLANQLG